MSVAQLLASRKALIFDLDGTLVDTQPDIRRAINCALRAAGYDELAPEAVVPKLHATLPDIIEAVTQMLGIPASAQKQLQHSYMIHYRSHAHAQSELYPGVAELLRAHQARGSIMAVCTNKNRADAMNVLDRCEILPFFKYVTGGDTTAHPKPDPAPLIHTLLEIDTEAADAILIGDTYADALCAQQARTGFILHRSGYGGQAALDCAADGHFENYSELY